MSLKDNVYVDYLEIDAQQPRAGDTVEVVFNVINDNDQVVEMDANVLVNGSVVHDEFVSILPKDNSIPLITVTVPNSPQMECCVELKNIR